MNILISIGSLGLGGAEKQAVWLANRLSLEHKVTLFTFQGGERECELSKRVQWLKFPAKESYQKLVTKLELDPAHQVTTSDNESVSKHTLTRLIILKQRIRITARRIFQFSEKYKFDRLITFPINILDQIIAYRKVRQIVNDCNPDLVITFLFHDTINVGLASVFRYKRPKLIVGRRSPIGYGDNSRGLMHRVALRLVYKLADMGVSNSKANVSSAIHDGLAESKIQIVPNFVTKPDFLTQKRSQRGPLKVVCIANMHWYKNHKNLLVAISKIVNQMETVQLTLIGNGPLFKEVVMLSTELGVPVMFEGFVSNPANKLYDFDAAILVSYFEGSSNAVLEALVAGIPVISSNTGSVSELISSGAPIILCDPDSPESIATAINSLKENYEDYLKKAQDYSDFLEIELGEDSVFKLWSALILNVTSV